MNNRAGKSPVSLPTDSFTRTEYTPSAYSVLVDVLQPINKVQNPLIDI